MRAPVDRARIMQLKEQLGRAASVALRVYFVGGTTAVIVGWRDATIDVDLMIRPHDDSLLRAIPAAKEALDINVNWRRTRAPAGYCGCAGNDRAWLGRSASGTPALDTIESELFRFPAIDPGTFRHAVNSTFSIP